ncbi:FixH family protein [Hyphobacterium sp. HN65]|uniref:FixH family protein n=1 Tax=Hyphobacterium lacteum TaxID=3116575 RepID=A0ABU7LRI2_9PROT|nr:FixH family protein [Hyphobacterium sp. HN65]MEE2526525.1 FixH family protein [Hyphobacterium sp. HN65]
MIREIKGRHVLIALLVFFGVIIAVDAFFVTTALRTFRGEDEPRSYVQGIRYNDVLERREEQAGLGWSATSVVTSTRVEIGVVDAQDAPVTGLVLDARLRHPADSGRDIELALTEISAGVYEADTEVPDGRWTLVVSTPEGPPFELEQDIWLQ